MRMRAAGLQAEALAKRRGAVAADAEPRLLAVLVADEGEGLVCGRRVGELGALLEVQQLRRAGLQFSGRVA
jgi:hypothetical protein